LAFEEFAGFMHMQRTYSITREGMTIIVPLKNMTYAELDAKALEHETQAGGHLEHARELRRYMNALGMPRSASAV
jgi:hypothetical protein